MTNKILLFVALVMISGCDDVPGQYRHNKNHHDQQEQKNSQIKADDQ